MTIMKSMPSTRKSKIVQSVDRTKSNHLSFGGPLNLENTIGRIASTNKAKEAQRQRELAVSLIKPVALNWISSKVC